MNETRRRPRALSAAAAAAVFTALTMVGAVGCSTAAGTPSAQGSDSVAVRMVDMHEQAKASPSEQIRLYTTMAHLWSQHMEWTYATVIAFAEDSPALQASLNRLLQNQQDIGDAIEPFYGAAAADQLTALLTEHIEGAVPVLVAAKAGDSAALQTALDAWYANAEAIADFLASANPHWKQAEMRDMMQLHITQTVAYAGDALAGDFAGTIADYDIAEAHMHEMADILAAGLIKQFPQMFK